MSNSMTESLREHRRTLAALILAGMVLAGVSGCAKRAPTAEPSQLPPQTQPEQTPEPEDQQPQDQDSDPQQQDSEEEQTPEEQPSEESGDPVYRLGSSGYQATFPSPFIATLNPSIEESLLIFVQDDPQFQGTIFYEEGDIPLEQLQTMAQEMETSSQTDKTITNFQQEVKDDPQSGLFTFTYSYSAGDTEGSPGGFYYIRYQKTPKGLITAQFITPLSTYEEAIRSLFDSIVPDDGSAVEVPQ